MANLNKVFLIGNLTRDPELRYLPDGKPVCNFGIAVNRTYITANKERKEDVCFLRIVVWGKQAESCSQYLSKGRSVFIEGRLQSRSWENSSGEKRSALDIIADRVQFLGAKTSVSKEEEDAVEDKEEIVNFDERKDEVPF